MVTPYVTFLFAHLYFTFVHRSHCTMSHIRSSHSSHHYQFDPSYNLPLPSSNPIQSLSLSPISDHSHSNDSLCFSRNSLLQSPTFSESSNRKANSRNNTLMFPNFRQPQSNPQQRFLNRSLDNCPTHLTVKQRTKWLKAGEKARRNQRLLSTTNPFHWSISHYDTSIYIHHLTPLKTIEYLIQKISDVHLFTIDTESDTPTKRHPEPIPALIQIQAVHSEHLATVILIEVQHLPHQSTLLFLNNFIYLISPLLLTVITFKNNLQRSGIRLTHILLNVPLVNNPH